jgi:hypothetical protein
VKNQLDENQFLEPTISTPAIEELVDYLTDRFTGKGLTPAGNKFRVE